MPTIVGEVIVTINGYDHANLIIFKNKKSKKRSSKSGVHE